MEKETKEIKAVEPAYKRHNYTKLPTGKARPAGNKTFKKFGKDIEIQDFINASADAVNLPKHIEQDQVQIKRFDGTGEVKTDETVIDMSMNFVQANKQLKVMHVLAAKAEKEALRKEAIAKAMAEAEKIEKSEKKGE